MSDDLKAGWGKSPVSRKWHYFPAGDTFSLCRKVGFFTSNEREDSEHDHKDNCAECKRKLAKDRGTTMKTRYRVQAFSGSLWGVWDTQKEDLIKNPSSNRTRLFRSPKKAQEFMEKYMKAEAKDV